MSAPISNDGWEREHWEQLSEAVAGFEAAWGQHLCPSLAPFLPVGPDPFRLCLLRELIKVDQEYRWQQGSRKLLEAYVREWPALAEDASGLCELLRAECLTRALFGDLPASEELRTRFPDLASAIDLSCIALEASEEARTRPGTSTPASAVDAESEHRGRTPLTPGATFGRYVIRGVLGSGGMATVFKAYDISLCRNVALKVPHSDAIVDPAIVERFLREGRAAAGIRHPHVVPVYDAGVHEGIHYLTMAFIPGRSLKEHLDTRQFSPTEAAEIVQKLARALECVHTAGILHRDIKAGNVMIDEAGEPILMDFGLARAVADDRHLTATGSLLGTPAYMSPEQIQGETGAVDVQSDIYSLGVLFYHLLTGTLPFTGSLTQVLIAIRETNPPAPRTLRPDIAPRLDAVCLKAMAKRPTDRYPSARDLAAALESAVACLPPTPAGLLIPRRWLSLGAAALLASVIVWAVSFFERPVDKEPTSGTANDTKHASPEPSKKPPDTPVIVSETPSPPPDPKTVPTPSPPEPLPQKSDDEPAPSFDPDEYPNIPATAHKLVLDADGNATITGAISPVGDLDWFALTFPRSGSLAITVDTPKSRLDPHVRLRRAIEEIKGVDGKLTHPVTAGLRYWICIEAREPLRPDRVAIGHYVLHLRLEK